MEEKQGYSITTYRFRLYQKHTEWFVSTKKLYCQVAGFYLKLISDRQFYALTDYELQRRTEVLTQGSKKDGVEAECPLPFGKVPLYFRRAALREAAAAARSWYTGNRKGVFPKELDTSPVYYKGMYRNLDLAGRRIELKLYTGAEWKWASYRFATDGREVAEEAELLSPTIKIEGKQVFLHFPVKETVEDVRTVKERAGERYLAVSLQLGEVFAACVAETPWKQDDGGPAGLDEGANRRIYMVRGGKDFRHKRRVWEEKLKSSMEADREREKEERGKEEVRKKGSAETERIRRKLRELIKRQAHCVSREIVEFAEQEGCKVIAVPDYQGSTGLDRKKYLPSGEYDWIGRRIVEYAAYKGFQKGIVLCRIPVKGISERCSRCGARIRRYNEGHKPGYGYLGGRLYECPNGHKGNTAVNTAENVGKRYVEMYGSGIRDKKGNKFSE